jgi:hypothetical protein
MPELKTKTPEGLKAFVHLGLVSASEARTASGANFSMDCPYCGADGALGIALQPKVKADITVAPGMWNCFKCQENGNTASLLQKIYALAKENPGDLFPLAEDRYLPPDLLQEYGIVQALYTEDWWLPVFNEANILTNIYRYNIPLKQQKSPYAFIGCPGCSAGLFNIQTLYSPPPGNTLKPRELSAQRVNYPVALAEGHWDTITLDHLLREAGKRSEYDVLGVPGANSWQPSWFRFIDNRPLELYFDHDPPREVNGKTIQAGWDGVQRVVKLAKESLEYRPSTIKAVEWKS